MKRWLLVGVGAVLLAGVVVAQPRAPRRRLLPSPPTLDCVAGAPACPVLRVAGDAEQVIEGYGPSPFRGFADPSLRRDPADGRLWMAYSWPHVQLSPPQPPETTWHFSGVVDIHLASSTDGGESWQYERSLWTSQAEINRGRTAEAGYSSYEVVTLAPRMIGAGTTWYAARMRYFVPQQGATLERRGDSFHLEISAAASPPALAEAAVARLGSALTAPGWGVDTNLAALSSATADCTIWNEPALHVEGDTLYLAAVCLVFDLSTGDRLPERERIELFATDAAGDVRGWTWRYVGRLAGPAEAAALGGQTLTQIDLARARDGALLALVSPNDWDVALQADVHYGLRVLEVASLEPPLLRRNATGAPYVRLAVTASDLPLFGPAASGYDAASATGVVFVRRVFDVAGEEMVWSLHSTGLHP